MLDSLVLAVLAMLEARPQAKPKGSPQQRMHALKTAAKGTTGMVGYFYQLATLSRTVATPKGALAVIIAGAKDLFSMSGGSSSAVKEPVCVRAGTTPAQALGIGYMPPLAAFLWPLLFVACAAGWRSWRQARRGAAAGSQAGGGGGGKARSTVNPLHAPATGSGDVELAALNGAAGSAAAPEATPASERSKGPMEPQADSQSPPADNPGVWFGAQHFVGAFATICRCRIGVVSIAHSHTPPLSPPHPLSRSPPSSPLLPVALTYFPITTISVRLVHCVLAPGAMRRTMFYDAVRECFAGDTWWQYPVVALLLLLSSLPILLVVLQRRASKGGSARALVTAHFAKKFQPHCAWWTSGKRVAGRVVACSPGNCASLADAHSDALATPVTMITPQCSWRIAWRLCCWPIWRSRRP